MKAQNYKNYVRLIPLWHYFTPVILILALIGSMWNMWRAYERLSGRLDAVVGFLLVITGLILYWYARYFALRAQDRAIRAEENFRHFVITGKPLDSRLRMGQIIALRFADDAEFVALAQKAANEKLSARDIKQMIVNWKPDYNRV